MSNITIGRYQAPGGCAGFSGWIEGADETGQRWITYIDVEGRPAMHFPRREPDGAVIGNPILLQPVPNGA